MVNEPAAVTDGSYAARFKASGRWLVDYCAQDLTLPLGDYTLTCDVVPSLGTTATLIVNFNTGAPPVTISTAASNQRTKLVLNFTVTDNSRPLTIYAQGNQRKYIRSNFSVDNFRLYRR